ncbi:MAG: carbohydrate-binding family 9-like protein [Pyrinomonadaceae bacterium]|nr:carbohydrate-binding family 9-like protein [Pyrinomonadaceae bacterium]
MLRINFTERDFAISDFENRIWRNANSVAINKYWSGELAAPERHSAARLLWSESFLYVRFDAVQKEPLIVNESPDLTEKADRLWERDVCELFIAPNRNSREEYFEFEVAPTGEWVDLKIQQTSGQRETDLKYHSGMETGALIDNESITMAMKIKWEAFECSPKAGERWLGNLFRIVGKDETRGYLAWRPTETEQPNFHVPEKFGDFEFLGK